MTKASHYSVRVYYEDTDAAGVVYYANYLKFIERGRTELLRSTGFEHQTLARELGIAFAVRSLSAEYLLPARLDDELDVVTTMVSLGRAQMVFEQKVMRADETLFSAQVRVVCFDPVRGKATAMPKNIYETFLAL